MEIEQPAEALSPNVSETSLSRPIFAPYCVGVGIDAGFGGDLVVPTAMGFDLDHPYTAVGKNPQTFRGTCEDLSGFCDQSLDYIHASHLLEDFTWPQLREKIIPEWKRVLKVGGLLLVNSPDQQKFLAHCAATGQGTNEAHKEYDFGLPKWNEQVVDPTGPWEVVMEDAGFGPYSFLQILRKV